MRIVVALLLTAGVAACDRIVVLSPVLDAGELNDAHEIDDAELVLDARVRPPDAEVVLDGSVRPPDAAPALALDGGSRDGHAVDRNRDRAGGAPAIARAALP